MNRRGFLFGGAVLLAAPSIVRAGSLMPVSVPKLAGIPIRIVTELQSWQTENLAAIVGRIDLDRYREVVGKLAHFICRAPDEVDIALSVQRYWDMRMKEREMLKVIG